VSENPKKPSRHANWADPEFAKRLKTAVSNHREAPQLHGQQKWLRERIEQKFGKTLSPEAIRRYFAGDNKPRPNIIQMIAGALNVDAAWLTYGTNPAQSDIASRQHKALAGGATNLIAGMIQLNGGHIAFPEAGETSIDLYAIIGGAQKSISVKAFTKKAEASVVHFPHDHERLISLIVVVEGPTSYRIYRVPSQTISDVGTSKGGYVEAVLTTDDLPALGDQPLALIRSFDNLDGEMPLKRKG